MKHTTTAVLVAAGNSTRMGFDKLAACMEGKTVLQRSVEAFDAHPDIDELVLVCRRPRASLWPFTTPRGPL